MELETLFDVHCEYLASSCHGFLVDLGQIFYDTAEGLTYHRRWRKHNLP